MSDARSLVDVEHSARSRVTAAGTLLAFLRLGQLLLLLISLWLLVAVRGPSSPAFFAVAVVVCTSTAAISVRSTHGLRSWAIYIMGFVAFALLRADADGTPVPLQYEYVIHVERFVFGGAIPTVWLQRHLHHTGHTSVLDVALVATYLSYFVAPHVTAVVIWRFRRPMFSAYTRCVIATCLVGLLVCAAVPTVPPSLASAGGRIGPVTPIVREVVGRVSDSAYGNGHAVAGTNEVAAMPSLHMAITVLIALFVLRIHRPSGVVVAVYAAAMGFSLVYIGSHYVTDLVAGAALAAAVFFVAGPTHHLRWPGLRRSVLRDPS